MDDMTLRQIGGDLDIDVLSGKRFLWFVFSNTIYFFQYFPFERLFFFSEKQIDSNQKSEALGGDIIENVEYPTEQLQEGKINVVQLVQLQGLLRISSFIW